MEVGAPLRATSSSDFSVDGAMEKGSLWRRTLSVRHPHACCA